MTETTSNRLKLNMYLDEGTREILAAAVDKLEGETGIKVTKSAVLRLLIQHGAKAIGVKCAALKRGDVPHA